MHPIENVKQKMLGAGKTLSPLPALAVGVSLLAWPLVKRNNYLNQYYNEDVYVCLRWTFLSAVFALFVDFYFEKNWPRYNQLSKGKRSHLIGTLTELPSKVYMTFAFYGIRCLLPGAEEPYNPKLILLWQIKACLLAYEALTQWPLLEIRMKAHHAVFVLFTWYATYTPLQATRTFQECLQIEGFYGFSIFGLFICGLAMFHADKVDSPLKFRLGQFLTHGMGFFKAIEWLLLLRCIGVFLLEDVTPLRLAIVSSMLFFCYLHAYWYFAFSLKLEKYRRAAFANSSK